MGGVSELNLISVMDVQMGTLLVKTENVSRVLQDVFLILKENVANARIHLY